MSAIASELLCTLKFLNSFARRQHLFDIAATPVNVNTNFLSYSRILLPCLCSNFTLNVIILMLMVVITSRKFHQNPFGILAKRKKHRWHWRDTRTNTEMNKAKTPPLQHRLRRYKEVSAPA